MQKRKPHCGYIPPFIDPTDMSRVHAEDLRRVIANGDRSPASRLWAWRAMQELERRS